MFLASDQRETDRGGDGASANASDAKNTPMLIVAFGCGNGNVGLGVLRASLERNTKIHFLGLEPSKVGTEFTQRRVAEAVYKARRENCVANKACSTLLSSTVSRKLLPLIWKMAHEYGKCLTPAPQAWFTKALRYKHTPTTMPDPLSEDALPPFDPSPLALTPGEGRLYIPEGYLGRFEGLESCGALIGDFRGEWYEKYTTGAVCTATIRNALLGKCGGGPSGSDAAAPAFANPRADADDPTNEADLKKMAMAGQTERR